MRYLLYLGWSLAGIMASADSLQLKDGTVYQGNYLGGSQTEIYFHRSGDALPLSVPVTIVQALKFEPVLNGSPAPSAAITPDAAVSPSSACRPASLASAIASRLTLSLQASESDSSRPTPLRSASLWTVKR